MYNGLDWEQIARYQRERVGGDIKDHDT